jgi:HD-GYP domain-containing protein (c-di-GMP phosphodiesterase class II)
VRLAFKAVNLTVNMVKRDQSWAKLLAQKNSNSFYSHHVSLLSNMVCIVAQNIGWSSEATQQKLIMAALLHDQFVDETTYEILQQNSNDSSEIIQNPQYRQHPIKVAELARTLRGLPNDVDHILLQHHERPDGSGFPRGLVASHISPFSAMFIVCEELLHFSHGKVIDTNMLNEFWSTFPEFLHKEPFKKISLSIINKV